MNAELQEAAVVYDVRLKSPGAHIYEVSCRVSNPDPGGQEFSLPGWIPGSYLMRDYARHVIEVTAESEGELLPLTKTDKSTWRVTSTSGSLLLRAEIYANDLSVRGAFLDFDHAFFNGVCLFFKIHGKESERCVVHIAPPKQMPVPEWQIATGLDRLTGTEGGFGAFAADDYDALIDHPVLIGDLQLIRFDVDGREHAVAINGQPDFDSARLKIDLQQICKYQADFFGGFPAARYVFLVSVLENSYGGLEHRNSSALVCSPEDLPRADDENINDNYRKFLGLVSHEYFHLWNVKRIRPSAFVPYRLEQEAYTRQLWVFEGITSYYDDLALLRSGLIAPDSYLNLLGRTLTGVYRSGGRRRQTLEDSSFDAWIKFYRQDENSPNSIVSYYRKGAMVALALDLELRLKTQGECSLDDVVRALWQQYGDDASHGLPEGGIERIAEGVSGLKLTEFFRQALRSTVDPPVGILLAQFGVRLNMRAAESNSDLGGTPGKRDRRPRPWLGFSTQNHGGSVMIKHVIHDGPAVDAGLSARDELVAINDSKVTPAALAKQLDRIPEGVPVRIAVFRRGKLREVTLTPVPAPRDICYLLVDTEAAENAVQRRQDWLGF
jgi:predicted metalloprotease with PDZ domain